MACLALHDKEASDECFVKWLPLLEEGATDERNFVKKGVSWALRGIATRNPEAQVCRDDAGGTAYGVARDFCSLGWKGRAETTYSC